MGNIPRGIFSTGLTTNAFKTDGDLIASAILDRMTDIMATEGGVVIDDLSETDLQIVDAGGGKVNIKAGNAYDKFGSRITLSTDDTASGQIVGTVDLTAGLDLSTNYNVKLDIDSAGAVTVDCRGATPAATTIDEIIAAINAAGFGTVAFRADSVGNPDVSKFYVLIKSSTTGGSSEVEFTAPASLDATNEIFGLSEVGYPHTFTGGGGYTIPDDSTTYNVLIEYLSVESVVGTFEGGYPTASDSQYTRRDDSYVATVQLATVTVVNDTAQHEQVLAEVSNTGGTLTITDKRGDILMRLKGQRQIDNTPPAAPVLVSLIQVAILTSAVGEIPRQATVTPRWTAVSDPSGIREYIVKTVLTERDGIVQAGRSPVEYIIQGFDPDASEIELDIDLYLGSKYDISVAAKDNSLSQNISPFTLLGSIYVGSESAADTVLMPQPNIAPITNGVAIDWPDADIEINAYEVTYAFGGQRPSWTGTRVTSTVNSEFEVSAAPGTEIQARIRIRRTNQTVSNEFLVNAVAGGTQVGDNEKTLTVQDAAVLATDDGKVARFLKRLYLPASGEIQKLAVDVTALTLNASDRGMVRVYRENEEAGAFNITFDVIGQHEIVLSSIKFSAGWIVVDAYDVQESGGSQAAFTTDVIIVYVDK